VRVGSILFGTAVALGFVLSASAIHAGSADFDEQSRVSGTVHRDVFPLRAPTESQTPADHVRVAGLEPHVGSDAVTNEQDLLEAVPASGWWNESFDERFPGLATQEFPSDLDFLSPPNDDNRTAIYDIAAHAVYLPNGRRLEAHSGIGGFIDDPRHAHVRNRGATPPNVYILSMRKRLFHGVRAIRLTPVDESKMHGRDGMLAHSYLHGPNGQSNGCVAFSNYPVFLNAFLQGDIARLVVVERLESPPEPTVASGSPPKAAKSLTNPSDRAGQYAAAD
jgi:Tlde1 domain